MTTRYEVQFLDGFKCWRRWSLCTTPEQAAASMARLWDRGIRSGRVKLVQR